MYLGVLCNTSTFTSSELFVFYIYRDVLLFDKGKILASIGSRALIIDIMHTYRTIGGFETLPRPLVQ